MSAEAGQGAWLVDLARFMWRPVPCGVPLPWGRTLLLVLFAVFVLDLALDALAAMVTEWLDSLAAFLPAPIEEETTLAEDLFGYLLFAPVLEELVYRGWLTGRIAALRFAAYGFAAEGIFIAGLFVPPALAETLGLTGVAVALAGLVHWSLTRAQDTAVPAWFTRHFHWFVWGSSLLFGLIHLGNYEPLASPLGVLVVLPQTIGGLLLAYTRTRLGLRAAIVHHAAYNVVFLAGEYGWW
ncbi:CPBP family glutamic-type intramembrane protease [Erythrobacter tepidarius]|uniref:CPBP family glutamic-type intramembrane protease n=1 Tax=Erythrobacter tepidarius TaxID=60454 RepID=UPI00117FE0FE|nr:CPBP family glutamic-type intramembrane protease [Erythrobacter tepidarius]